MKIIKKIGSFVVAGCFLFCLTGCGQGLSEEPLYELKEEVKEAAPTSGVCQIDNVVLNVNGSTTVKEFMEDLCMETESEKSPYGQEEYNPQMLVASEFNGTFNVSKNGADYISVSFWNSSSKTAILEECYVVAISPYSVATPYFWLAGGMCLNQGTLTWDNITEELEKTGWKPGDTDTNSLYATPSKAAYEDRSESTNFRYYLTINYDNTLSYEEWTSEQVFYRTSYIQSITYVVTFDKDSHLCLSVESQGFNMIDMKSQGDFQGQEEIQIQENIQVQGEDGNYE